MEYYIIAKSFISRMNSKHAWYTVITLLLLYVYIDIKREIKSVKKLNYSFELANTHSNYINLRLNVIRKQIGASQLSISGFHNGVITFERLHIQHMSRIFEAKADSVLSKDDITDKYPTIKFQSQINRMIAEDYVYVKDVNECDDLTIQMVMRQYNVKSIIYMPIRFRNEFGKRVVGGFACIEYKNKTNFSEKYLSAVQGQMKEVEFMIDNAISESPKVAKKEL